VDEPEGGAQTDVETAAKTLDQALWRNLRPLLDDSPEHLQQLRYERFRYIDSLVTAHPDFGPKVEGGNSRGSVA
jgi:acetyl-CoA carboxylase alpha subunit